MISVIIYLVSLLLLYIVIETAVKNGINSSVIGRYIKEESGDKEEQKPDLDNDHHHT